MTFYVDENMSASLAEAFNILQQGLNADFKKYGSITVSSVTVEFGAGTKDEVWIPLAGQGDACIITQDYNIHRIADQRRLCEENEITKNFIKHWK